MKKVGRFLGIWGTVAAFLGLSLLGFSQVESIMRQRSPYFDGVPALHVDLEEGSFSFLGGEYDAPWLGWGSHLKEAFVYDTEPLEQK